MPVQTRHKQYDAMAPKWEKCRDTTEGSDAVKAKRTEYLPRLDSHENDPAEYDAYLLRAYFYGVMKRTIDGLAGEIFRKAPSVNFPKTKTDVVSDITLNGKSLDDVALETVKQVLMVGRSGILVDMSSDEATTTRPYAAFYRAEAITSWRSERRGGDEILTQVVFHEGVEEPDPEDPFVVKRSDRYRVCELVEDKYVQTIWTKEKEDSDKYTPGELIEITRNGKPLTRIPFVFFGPTGNSPDVEIPPLDALADTNLSHYRDSADNQHGLHFLGVPMPWISGKFDDDKLTYGPKNVLMLGEGGAAGVLQADGRLLGALKESLDRKEKIMAVLGARLLEEQPSTQETATAVSMRHAGEHATLGTIAQTVEGGLTRILQWLAWWMGAEQNPEDIDASVELNKDFVSMRLTPQELQALIFAYQSEAMPFETLYENLKKGELTRPGVTAEEELAAISRGGGNMGDGGGEE